MHNWLDWLLLLLLLVSAFRGYRRGAIREIGGLVAYIAGVLAAMAYAPKLAVYLVRAFPLLTDRLAAWLVGTAAASRAAANPLLTSPLGNLFDLGLPVGPLIGQWLANGFMTVIAFVLIFLVVLALVRWLASLVSAAFHRTPLGGIDRLLGLLLGGFLGALFLGLALSLATFFAKLGSAPGPEGPFRAALNGSVLAPQLTQLFAWAASQLKLLLKAP